jgi:hypothetical protein
MCCGQKRAQQKADAALARARARPVPTSAPAPAAQARETGQPELRYLGDGTIALRGPRTGRVYYFDAAGDPTAVHADDADALLRTGLLARG